MVRGRFGKIAQSPESLLTALDRKVEAFARAQPHNAGGCGVRRAVQARLNQTRLVNQARVSGQRHISMMAPKAESAPVESRSFASRKAACTTRGSDLHKVAPSSGTS